MRHSCRPPADSVSYTGRRRHAIQTAHSQYVHLWRNNSLTCPHLPYKYRCVNKSRNNSVSLTVTEILKISAAAIIPYSHRLINDLKINKPFFVNHLKDGDRTVMLNF